MDELTKEFLRLISAIPDKEAIYQILISELRASGIQQHLPSHLPEGYEQ